MLAAIGLLQGQNAIPPYQPRPQVSDYAASKAIAGDTQFIGAESLAHSVPISRGGMLFAENHIVIEAAFYGPVRQMVSLAPEHFTLLLNGKKVPILVDSPGAVAGSMRDSIFTTGPNLEASGSVGDAGVVLGRRRPQTGVPGLDTPPGRRPGPPQAPAPENRSGVPLKRPLDVREEIERVSLNRGEYKLPSGGLLYFPFRGKLKSIKNMVLQYSPPGGTPVELTLIPMAVSQND